MLDVISGAMGAFLIMVIILLPYYRKESRDWRAEAEREQAERIAAEGRIEELQQQLEREREQATARLEEAEKRIRNTFLVVRIRWTTALHDVDLHVVDPAGAEFYWSRPTIPGRPGELAEDDIRGPGGEVWLVPVAEPGEYRVYYNLFRRNGNPQNPQIAASIFSREGERRLPAKTLTREGDNAKVLAAKIVIGRDGSIRIDPL